MVVEPMTHPHNAERVELLVLLLRLADRLSVDDLLGLIDSAARCANERVAA